MPAALATARCRHHGNGQYSSSLLALLALLGPKFETSMFPPFSGHTGTTEPHLFFSHLVPLQYPLLYTFFPHGFRVRYIQVTRSAEAETDGLHATVQAVNHCAR